MQEKKAHYSYFHILKDFKQLLVPYRARFWLGSFLRLSCDLLALYSIYMLSESIAFFTNYTPGDSLNKFWYLLMIWFFCLGYIIVVRQFAKYLCYRVAEKIKIDAQLLSLQHLSLIDIAWHERENTGNKLKRVANGGEGWNKLIRIWVDKLIENAVNIIGITIIVSLVDIRVGIIMLIFLATYFAISIPLAHKASLAAKVVNKQEEDFEGLAFESLNNIRTIKVMNLFPHLSSRLQKKSKQLFDVIIYRIFRFRFKAGTQALWAHFFRSITTAVIAVGIYHGQYNLSFLLLFNLYFTNLRESVEELSEVSQDIIVSRHHLSRVNDIFLEPVRIDSDTNKKNFPSAWKKISVQNLSFSYGENQVLNNVSFDIKPGEKIGIVGLSGAGKSTLFKLLLKEYEDYTGDILIDNIALRKIKRSSYFEHIAIVPQETEVFNFSLEDNIRITANSEVSPKKKIDRAINIAHIHDFLQKLPQGLHTLIGEKGIKLSGGEKQRVGIARAVFKEPEILFLDEATSHLDVESEEKIKASLHEVFQNVTAFVIAHRLSTIQEMDRILVFEKGELIQQGTFQKLSSENGRFSEFWEKQKL